MLHPTYKFNQFWFVNLLITVIFLFTFFCAVCPMYYHVFVFDVCAVCTYSTYYYYHPKLHYRPDVGSCISALPGPVRRNDLLGLEGMVKLTNPEDTLTSQGTTVDTGGAGTGSGTDQPDRSEPESISKRLIFACFVLSYM